MIRIWLGVFVVLLTVSGLQAEDRRRVPLTIQTSDTDTTVKVEVAATPSDRQRGLMFRQSMAPDHGMLFDFGSEQAVTMWMRNTYISLDMLFADKEGVIHTIARNTRPFSEETIPGSKPARYVLEINAGQAKALGIQRGDRIVLPPG